MTSPEPSHPGGDDEPSVLDQPPGSSNDNAVRARLMTAQRTEATAVQAVLQAERRLARERAQQERVIAAAHARIDRVRQSVGAAQQDLIDVSGLARAAKLLGVTSTVLRRTVKR